MIVNRHLMLQVTLSILIVLPSIQCQVSFLDVFLRSFYRRNRLADERNLARASSAEHSIKMAARIGHVQKEILKNVTFPCPVNGMRSPTRPTSVHRLRPGDIDIIGALGDSFTAGNGAVATKSAQTATENRGLSYLAGGQKTWRQFFTLPNILKEYNPNLFGYSLGDSLALEKASQFNCADIIAMSRDMPYMAKEMIIRMKNDPRVDIKRHWKMVSIFTGFNDFGTDICYSPSEKSFLAQHRKDMIQTLRILRDNLPRTFVNIVLPLSFDAVVKTVGGNDDCLMSRVMGGFCFYSDRFKKNRKAYIHTIKKWHNQDMELDKIPEFNDRDDFAVVVQPFVKNLFHPTTKDGRTDFTYLSKDCFHFSQKGHARAANALWNNMMEPVGKKTKHWDMEFSKFICPTSSSPYIYTPRNGDTQQKKIVMFDAFK